MCQILWSLFIVIRSLDDDHRRHLFVLNQVARQSSMKMSYIPLSLFFLSLSLKSETLEFLRMEHDYYRDHYHRSFWSWIDKCLIFAVISISLQSIAYTSFTFYDSGNGWFPSLLLVELTTTLETLMWYYCFDLSFFMYVNGRKSKVTRAFRISFEF
jgi:hypothetical protein